MTISKVTVSTSIWDVVYQHLQTGTYAISTNNIFSAWNSTLAQDKGYPIVIIYPPSIGFEKFNVTGSLTQSEVVIEIAMYHTSAKNIKVLVDEVLNSIMTGKKVFEASRLMRMEIEGTDYNTWEDGKKKIHMSSFNVSFRWIA